MIQAVIVDCFGVLYGSSLQTLRSLCPPGAQDELSNLAKLSDYGYLTRHEFSAAVAELSGHSFGRIDTIITEKRQRNTALVQYIGTVHERGLKTALLSNVGSDIIERLFTHGELQWLFDEVVLSYKVQLRKPDDRIYRLCAERLGVSLESCVMIDDMQENCDGAQLLGMQTIRHTTNQATEEALEALLRMS